MTVVNVPYFSSFIYWQLWGGGWGGANLIFGKGMEVTFIHVYVHERMQKQHT